MFLALVSVLSFHPPFGSCFAVLILVLGCVFLIGLGQLVEHGHGFRFYLIEQFIRTQIRVVLRHF